VRNVPAGRSCHEFHVAVGRHKEFNGTSKSGGEFLYDGKLRLTPDPAKSHFAAASSPIRPLISNRRIGIFSSSTLPPVP